MIRLLLAALLALAPLAATAEIAVEYYDGSGQRIERATLYSGRAHMALVIATETGTSAGAPAERDALLAWLEARGVEATELLPGAAPLAERAEDWLREADRRARDGGLLVVIDSRVSPGPEGFALDRGAGVAEPPLRLRPFLEALDESAARHVLVVFTTLVDARALPEADEARVAPGEARRRAWLREEEAAERARQALVPYRGAETIPHLVAALSESPEFGAAEEHYDPDAFVTAEDLAAAGGTALQLWRFGRDDEDGNFVLLRRGLPEIRFDGRPSLAERYREAFADLRRGDERALGRFLDRGAEGPWREAARAQNERLSERILARENARCDAAFAFRPDEILALEAGVLGRLDAFSDAGKLARDWLAAVEAATGLAPPARRQIEARCAEADLDPATAPARALRLALATGDGARALAIPAAAGRGWAEAAEAAVLATLHLLAEGGRAAGAEEKAAALEALDRAAEDGHGAAALLGALLSFDGSLRPRDPRAGMAGLARAAERGVAVAEALRAAVWLSPHPGPTAWRPGRTPNRQAALTAIRFLREARIALDPELGISGLEAQSLRDCARSLSALDLEAAFAPASVGSLAALDALVNRPHAALAEAVRVVPEAAARAACARLPAPEDLAAEDLPVRDDVLLRLAVLDVAARDPAAARDRLAEIGRPTPTARLVAALAAEPAARGAAFAAAAEAGQPLAALAAAAVALAEAETGPARRAALDRLAAMGDDGLAVADALMAVALFRDAAVGVGAGPAARAAGDRALIEGMLRAWTAGDRGVDTGLGYEDAAVFATRTPGMLGFALGEVTDGHRRLLGRALPDGVGGLVLDSDGRPGGLDPGDVILGVNGETVESLAGTQMALQVGLILGLRGGGPLTLEVWSAATGETRRTRLAVPPHISEIAVPPALRL